MFCKKCGCEHTDNAAFCTQCGASLTSEALSNELLKATIPMTKTDYFSNHCSGSVQKKRKAIKWLSITCLVIQGVLNILVIISLSVLAYALQQTPLWKDADLSGLGLVITLSLMFTAGSFVFTILGMKKNGTGFFVGATVFAFISTTFGCLNFGSLVLRQLVVFGMAAIYLSITILNHQNNKEYKMYVRNNSKL